LRQTASKSPSVLVSAVVFMGNLPRFRRMSCTGRLPDQSFR
jgi:hypothetical protein